MSFRPLTEDYISVVTIPSNVVPISSPSKAIERLLKKRENGHNVAVKFVKLTCQKHNVEIEEEIRQECERIKEILAKIKTQIENETKAVMVSNEEELASLNVQHFQNVAENVVKCDEERTAAIDTFYETLKSLERKRTRWFKNALQEGYQKMAKISHLSPFELMNYFETEATSLNKITLSNYRYYAKIRADLKLQAQEEMRMCHLTLLDAKDKYKTAYKIVKIRGALEIRKSMLPDTQMLGLSLQNLKFTEELPRSGIDVEMWAHQIKQTLDELDNNAKKLISMYKLMVINVYNRLFGELQNVTEALNDDKVSREIDIDFDIYKPIIEEISENYKCDVETLQTLWNTITGYMESNLQNTNVFLTGCTHLWDAHFVREIDAKNLTLEELKQTINMNDKSAQNFDKKINTTLDQLREDPNVAHLDQHLKEANKFLDSIEKLYSSQCDSEIKAVEKYYHLMTQAIDLLISEIDAFVYKNASSECIQKKRSSWQYQNEDSLEPSKDELIPFQMKACQYQVDAVNNWMFGLWETLRIYITTCRQELSREAENWIKNIVVKLKKRLEVRLAMHKPRYQRIKATIYDVRLKELQDHLHELNAVEENIKKRLGDSRSVNQLYQDQRLQIIEDYEKAMRKIDESLQKATKSQHVASCMARAKTTAQTTKEKLNQSFEENGTAIDGNRSETDQMICHFNSSIKLFADGGNYTRDEAKVFVKRLQKTQKGLPKQWKKIFDEFSTVRKSTLRKFEEVEAAILARLEKSKTEFEHKEKVCSLINNLRLALRNVAYEMKFKVHRLDACVHFYADMSKTNLWKRKQFDLMKQAVDDCLERIKELTELLTHDYINRVEVLLAASLNEVDTLTKIFYDTHETIINKGKIHESYHDFMEEVNKSYHGFKKQTTIHCLECLQELVEQVFQLLLVNDEVYESLLVKFPGLKVDEEKEIRRKLTEEALLLDERKGTLEKHDDVSPAVVEIVQENEERERVLRGVILELWECVNEKNNAIERVVSELGSNEAEDVENSLK